MGYLSSTAKVMRPFIVACLYRPHGHIRERVQQCTSSLADLKKKRRDAWQWIAVTEKGIRQTRKPYMFTMQPTELNTSHNMLGRTNEMTTRDFIQKTYNVPASRERRCSSVFTDHKGVVYSYGYHYPLAFNIGGVDFINVAGYSSTTAKHIHWARQAIDGAVEIELPQRSGWAGSIDYTLGEMLGVLRSAREVIAITMRDKKRKNTKVYHDLFVQLNKTDGFIRQIQEAMA